MKLSGVSLIYLALSTIIVASAIAVHAEVGAADAAHSVTWCILTDTP